MVSKPEEDKIENCYNNKTDLWRETYHNLHVSFYFSSFAILLDILKKTIPKVKKYSYNAVFMIIALQHLSPLVVFTGLTHVISNITFFFF